MVGPCENANTKMKILHLFSNWKWTGPAEPAVNLCLSLKEMGHDVVFACGSSPDGNENFVALKAAERGVPPVTEFNLRKHFRFASNIADLFALRRFLKAERFDIVHTHLPNDHLVGGFAARRSGSGAVVIRTDYSGDALAGTARNRYLIKRLTDGLLVVSDAGMAGNIERFGLDERVVGRIEGAVDLDRFVPGGRRGKVRTDLGIKENDVVVGIVARVQRHRQFDLLLRAVALAVKEFAGLKLLVIGRGTHINEIAVEPVKMMEIGRNVVFSGYRSGDYVDVLDCMDINVFLVPGSDGSCRAVREVMAMGKPVIASRRGILPELLGDGETGLNVAETPQEIASAILRLVSDEGMRVRLGKLAREKAVRDFGLQKQAAGVDEFYRAVIHRIQDPVHNHPGV